MINLLRYQPCIFDKFYALVQHLISKNQHGFVKNRSIVTNLFNCSARVLESLEEGAQTDVIFFDFTKAFDCVDHNILIDKLHKIGVTGKMLDWFKSYLDHRYQAVKIRETISEFFSVTSGVPQGSNLGPLLFIMFINDLTSCIKYSFVDLYADDVRIYKKIKSFDDCIKLQMDITALHLWSARNNINLSIPKCNVMSICRKVPLFEVIYKIGNQELLRVNSIKHLGIIFDSHWAFSEHIQYITSKAFKMIGFIKRSTFKFKSLETVTYLYKSLVLPLLTFGSVIWSPFTATGFSKLESVNKKFLRYASTKTSFPMSYNNHNYNNISSKCKIYTIRSYHHANDLIFVYKTIKNECDLPNHNELFVNRINIYNLRNFRTLFEKHNTRNFIFNSPLFRLRRFWNTWNYYNTLFRNSLEFGVIDIKDNTLSLYPLT